MFRKQLRRMSVLITALAVACGSGGSNNDLEFPAANIANSGTSSVSAQFRNLGDGVPAGRRITFVGDEITIRGEFYVPGMAVFFGVDHEIQDRPDSLFDTPRHLLPNAPFVYTDPVTGEQTQTEARVNAEFSTPVDIKVSIPAAAACTDLLTNPTLRFYGKDGSSFPAKDIFHVVGPVAIALTPRRIPDVGGESVIVHGDFFSLWTQIAFRYTDPATGETRVVGASAEDDIEEIFIDRNTLVIPKFPGVVPNSKLGLAEELIVDILVFENIDEITSNANLEPALGGKGACDELRQQGTEIPLEEFGVRNSEKAKAFTFLPTGVTDYPSIAGIVPEEGSEVGGNTVVIHGDQFDGFTVDLTNPQNPGIGIECPPGSGIFVAPISAILVDRQTIVVKMPPCEVEIPEKVAFCLTNKYSIDNPDIGDSTPGADVVPASANGTCVIFPEIYSYLPIPPIVPPIVTAIHPISQTGLNTNEGNDYGLQKFLVVGDWFDGHTTLNGGFEFVLPTGEVVQSLRTVLHNRNLIEIYTERLPDSLYPLTSDVVSTVRVRNVVGHRDFDDSFTFKPMPDAGATPTLSLICGDQGPSEGNNQILIVGTDFDTTTDVLFSGVSATAVQFVNPELLIATVPSAELVGQAVGTAALDTANVTVEDDGEAGIGGSTYLYGNDVVGSALGSLDPNIGSSTGGYYILAYGVDFSPLARVEFGVGDGNFSPNVYYLGSNLLSIEVPEAFPAQIGATVDVGITDPLNGLNTTIKTVEFTYTAAQQAAPEIVFVDTTVEVPVTPTSYPALNVTGGDRMLIIGRNFDQRTRFDITKPQASSTTLGCTEVEVLTPNIAVCRGPVSPDGLPGLADLTGTNDYGTSPEFVVEYVQPGPPAILDVRNLNTGSTDAPIDANDRLLIFGDNFFQPVGVKLTGCDINDPSSRIEYIVPALEITVVEDHIIGVNIPADMFCEGSLGIEVTTDYGSVKYTDTNGDDIFQLVGPQPPVVDAVFPGTFNSGGGEEAIFYGRNFTPTTQFAVRSNAMTPGVFQRVLDAKYVSSDVAIIVMPALPGGMPPVGLAGQVRSEETDANLVKKITGDSFTVSGDVFNVVNDQAPMLLGIYPDNGSTDGGEQVLLTGAGFLTALGDSNVTSIEFDHSDSSGTLIDIYTEATLADLPLDSRDPASRGLFQILNDHQILLVTESRPAIVAADFVTADVTVNSTRGATKLAGGYTYLDTPADIVPILFGFTPNETKVSGGTSHLVSGGFLTAATKLVFTGPLSTLEIPMANFAEVNDSFLVFTMPDLTGTFKSGDVLSLRAEKVTADGTVSSNTIYAALTVTFAGPPTITPALSPATGTGFGGTVVTIKGTLFTSNSQVLFGTMPAKTIVVASPTTLFAVAPTLPVTAPGAGLSLSNLDSASGKVDVAVFTQGGWAVLADAYTFTPDGAGFVSCTPTEFTAGQTQTVSVTGSNFVPGVTTVTSVENNGIISNVVVHSFNSMSFDYAAKTFASGTTGPLTDSFTIETNMGSIPGCALTISLPPFLSKAETSYKANTSAAPTTGVAEGAFIEVTLSGGNLLAGGALTMSRGGSTDVITLTETVGSPTGPGQWTIVDASTIVFTAPNVFSTDVPTLIDGNRNVGPVTISYKSGAGNTDLSDAFSYVATVIDFDDFSFNIPVVTPASTIPQRITTGDINADGVMDMVALARQPDWSNQNKVEDPDAFVYIADTFGPGVDVDGDGESPDFAGTFTRTVISNDTVRTYLYRDARGGKIRLANLDDDDQLELIIPAQVRGGSDQARVLLVDVDGNGAFSTETVLNPSSITSSFTISGIAVGNFDSGHSGVDIAATIGGSTAERKIVIFASDGADFDDFSDSSTSIDAPFNGLKVGFLESGDFDDDGDDDLIWGHSAKYLTSATQAKFPIVVVDIDADAATAAGKVVSQKKLTNFTGGSVKKIEVYDIDGNGNEDAVIIAWEGATGSLLNNEQKPGVIAIVLDPLGLEADDYFQTGFLRQPGNLGDGGSNHLASGDFNGDGTMDLVVLGNEREFSVFFGNAVPATIPTGFSYFRESGRSWNLTTTQPDPVWVQAVDGVASGDFNRDGLDEILVADAGANPKSIIFWLNTSR